MHDLNMHQPQLRSSFKLKVKHNHPPALCYFSLLCFGFSLSSMPAAAAMLPGCQAGSLRLAPPLLACLFALACWPGAAAAEGARPARRMLWESSSITNATMQQVLAELSTKDNTVLLAVVRLGEGKALDTAKNWALSLLAHDLLRHTLLIAADKQSLEVARAAGLPALLDKAFPTNAGPWAMDRQPPIINRIYDVSKHWWGMRIVEHGYNVLYMDVDMVLMRDPLPLLRDAPFDVQGLSDFFGPELMPIGGVLNKPCDFYKLVREEGSPTGAEVREVWDFRQDNAQTALQVTNPCQSTGFWYVRPTPAGKAFMHAMVMRLFTQPWSWDQSAWQEVIMAFLIGMGKEPPLRLNILPVEQFANLGVIEDRLKAKLPVDPIVLHAGAKIGTDVKICSFAEFNLWHPELWQVGQRSSEVHTAAMVCNEKRIAFIANFTFPTPSTDSQLSAYSSVVGPGLRSLLPGAVLSPGEEGRRPAAAAPLLAGAAVLVAAAAAVVAGVAFARRRQARARNGAANGNGSAKAFVISAPNGFNFGKLVKAADHLG